MTLKDASSAEINLYQKASGRVVITERLYGKDSREHKLAKQGLDATLAYIEAMVMLRQ